MSVYQTINAIQAELCKEGITKSSKNATQGYMFRGIDAVYNTLSPLMASHGLCIMPRMLARTVTEQQSKNGGILFYVVVEAEFDFICAQDGSKHTVKTFGEAMDSGDKATNKAMSAAYKYAAFQTFAIPTEGDNDADASTHAVVEVKIDAKAEYEDWLAEKVNLMDMDGNLDPAIEAEAWKKKSSKVRSAIKAYGTSIKENQ